LHCLVPNAVPLLLLCCAAKKYSACPLRLRLYYCFYRFYRYYYYFYYYYYYYYFYRLLL
jgi:hypothetical protein